MTATQFDGPETPEMAEEWDRRASAYRRAGLCDACASSASYGHQLGWLRVPHPPCHACAPMVATFPARTVDPTWRKWPKGRPSWPSPRSAAEQSMKGADNVLTGLSAASQRT